MKGYLVIAGGNIKGNIIYERFVELAGGPDAKIAIVSTASQDSVGALLRMTDKFVECGVDRSNIIGLKVDPDVEGNNEWKKCGDEFETLDFLDDVNGFWFSGGDQVKIIRGFVRNNGTDTKLLQRIREILNNGGTVGGSSAGAAVMSQIMIGGGTSFGALTLSHYYDYVDYRNRPELEDKGALLVMNGLGFFKEGIVDQHFDKRCRQGRLIETMFDKGITTGYGISEDTALVYDIEKGLISTVGSRGVAVVDISEGIRSKIGGCSEIKNVVLSFLKGSGTYDVNRGVYDVDIKSEIREQDYYAHMKYVSNILLNAPSDFSDAIGRILKIKRKDIFHYLEEKKMHYIKDYQSGDEEVGYEIRFYKKDGYTRGFAKGDGSFVNIILDMLPVTLKAGVSREAVE